jgi:lysophospholipase L1-like esterase
MTPTPLSFLAIGDSYTIGEMVETSQRWPNQLVQLLATENVNFQLPIPIAHTGFTTDELLTSIRQFNINGKFDLVSLLIGVNNQYRNYSIEKYATEFAELLQYAILRANNKSRVFVVSIPDWGFTPFGEQDKRGAIEIGKEIDLYNKIAQQICKKNDVQFIDITGISKNHDSTLLATDQLHPSGKQYRLWAEKIFENLKDTFNH